MNKLLIVNIISQWIVIATIVAFLLHEGFGSRLEFKWRTTFFGKTRHGFDVTLWAYSRTVIPNYGHSIFTFDWRNPKTIPDKPYIKDAKKWAMPSLVFERSTNEP